MPQKIPEKGIREKKGKKREKGLQSPPSTAHHPKTVIVADAVAAGLGGIAGSGTAVNWKGVPRTAPQ
nr:hypothetical protein [Microcystis aeruginosa]